MIRALAFAALAATASAAEPEIADHFRPFAFLAGSCWHGPYPDGQKIDSHCFKWFQRGRCVRDRNELIGSDPPYGGEATYFWDHARNGLAYIYWANDGGISQGSARVENGMLVFPDEIYRGPDGELRLKTEIRRTGPDSFERKVWVIGQDGAETPFSSATYTRQPLNW
ncbi:MAG: hypothetical protein FJX59_10915 [Alphaproteobacteria bacterium]|nr:hypothetical protein [Alphaproteobacteria bacterium]